MSRLYVLIPPKLTSGVLDCGREWTVGVTVGDIGGLGVFFDEGSDGM